MAQDYSAAAKTYFQNNAEKYGLSRKDLSELIVTDVTPSEGGLIQHVYLRQGVQGIGIYGAELSATFDRNGKVASEWAQGYAGAHAKVNASAPSLNQREAIASAAKHLGLKAPDGLTELLRLNTQDLAVRFNGANVSQEEIPVRLVYFQADAQNLRLAWDLNILPHGKVTIGGASKLTRSMETCSKSSTGQPIANSMAGQSVTTNIPMRQAATPLHSPPSFLRFRTPTMSSRSPLKARAMAFGRM